eukprot:839589-Pyramimonas_sp.AAC.1
MHTQWAPAVQKYRDRARAIASAGADAAACGVLYRERAVSVLQYKSQLFELPRAEVADERRHLARLFRAP